MNFQLFSLIVTAVALLAAITYQSYKRQEGLS